MMNAAWVSRVGRLPDQAVGIMADSHGRVATIAAALSWFHAAGCRPVVHLGDICDSETPATVNDATRQLMGAGVLAVMGNNERALLQRDPAPSGIDDRVRAFLVALPLQIEATGTLFVHNRPFPDRLGMTCLTGEIGDGDYRRVDRRCRGVVLFRGHGHQPSVGHTGSGTTTRGLTAGQTMVLHPDRNWIVTCGALQTGWCMIWHPHHRRLTACRLCDTEATRR